MGSTWPGDPQAAPAPAVRRGGANAVPSRLRSLLLAQREKLRTYLRLLEHQERSIREEDVLKLEIYVELERSILAEIDSLRRVIDPLRELARQVAPVPAGTGAPEGGDTVSGLERSLARLQAQVAERNRSNCRLLEERMETLRQRIRGLSRPRTPVSPFARAAAPALVDISL